LQVSLTSLDQKMLLSAHNRVQSVVGDIKVRAEVTDDFQLSILIPSGVCPPTDTDAINEAVILDMPPFVTNDTPERE